MGPYAPECGMICATFWVSKSPLSRRRERNTEKKQKRSRTETEIVAGSTYKKGEDGGGGEYLLSATQIKAGMERFLLRCGAGEEGRDERWRVAGTGVETGDPSPILFSAYTLRSGE